MSRDLFCDLLCDFLLFARKRERDSNSVRDIEAFRKIFCEVSPFDSRDVVATKSHQPSQPFSFSAEDEDIVFCAQDVVALWCVLLGLCVEGDSVPSFFSQRCEGLREVGVEDGDRFQRAAGGFGDRGVFLGGVSLGEQKGLDLEEAGATQDGTDVVRILNSVEHDERRRFRTQRLDERGERGRGQGVAFQGEGLVRRTGFVEFVDRSFGGQGCLGKPSLCGVRGGMLAEEGGKGFKRLFCDEQLRASSTGVGKSGGDRVHAVHPVGRAFVRHMRIIRRILERDSWTNS